MITHIRMKNFKSWEDSGEVQLAPLTGFFGTNSSGKSSLLQMLLLLKQTIGSDQYIFFGDENSLVNLGNFREVIHGHKENELLELEFGCKFSEPITIRITQYRLEANEETFDSFNFETTIQKYGNSQDVSRICYDIGNSGIKKMKLEGSEISYCGKRLFTGTYKNCYSIEESTQAFPGSNDSFNLLSSKFEDVFSCIYPLGPTRVNPQRHYHWEGTSPENIGQGGEDTISALLSGRIDQRTTPYNGTDVSIEDRISAWLREMDLVYSFSLNRTGPSENRNYEVRVQKNPDNPKVTLADMGYGLAQFLPVLVHCYYAPQGSTLILEQPGIHLHPMVQSQLADLLIEVIIERNLQILIESHSEHLLNRLQRRIAEEKISVDKTALYFCRNDEGVSNIERLKMDEFGNISNWPEDFFGSEMGDLFSRAEAEMARRKKAEG